MGWTRSKAWSTGIRSEVETFSGAGLPAPWGSNSASTGVVATDTDADRTLVTDQAGKQRISRTNGLGQLKEVWEIVPASDSSTVSVTFPGTAIAHGYRSAYNYDPLNNLTQVDQPLGATTNQIRSFTYSSLSRLLSAENPESGTIQYAYDPNGNLTSKKDARNITTAYSYDALNRVTERSYDDNATLPVYYAYDNLTHAKGKLTKVTTGPVTSPFSITEYTEFDDAGRVKKSRQKTDGSEYYQMEYTYNLSGAMVEEKYPSGRIVKTVLDSEGDLQSVKSQKNANNAFWNYANHFTYTAAGAVASLQLGNGTWEKTAFNSRLQPTQIALGKVQNATDLLKLDYTYGVVESSQLNTAKNNGNIQSQTITAPTITGSTGFTAVQTYNYDALNRIDDATEMVTPAGSSTAAQSWKQDYTFDRYGNRNFIEANTTTIPKYCANNSQVCPADRKVLNPSISASTNRINLDQDGDSVNDYAFDASGNTTKDANGRTFLYDAENKQIEIKNASNETIGKYWYDGDGRRVKKRGWINGQWETTVFIYDASSRLVAEYSTNLNETPQVAYLTNDHLGSPRINTDENGKVTARHDYRPYGEEVTERTHAEYVGDTIRKQFTGYERDNETDLDFAQARYLQFGHGRFTSADEVLNDSHASVPQSWNLFVYCGNNPTINIDVNGKEFINSSDPNSTLSDERLEVISADLRRKTGLTSIRFVNGIMTYDKNEKAKGGSEKLRNAILGAINDQKNIFILNDSSGSNSVHFMSTNAGATVESGGVKKSEYQISIDFADFENAANYSDADALQAFSVGINLYHETNHKVSYDVGDPIIGGPGVQRPDTLLDPKQMNSNFMNWMDRPSVIQNENSVQNELGLPMRDNSHQATKGPKGTFQISFTDPSGRQKFVRWKLEGSR